MLAGVFGLLSGCKKVCDTDDLPRYPLTSSLRDWSAPYPKDAVLRFRNASTGYVRSYRVAKVENETPGIHSGVDPCPQHYREYTSHVLERSDSTGGRENKSMRFDVFAATNTTRLQASFAIGSTSFELPFQEIEDGTQTLPSATFAGRTYSAVLGRTSGGVAFSGGGVTLTAYLTKAEGLIRFEERGGTVWDRVL